MSDKEVNIDYVLKFLRDQIGIQAQEIAILKATIASLPNENDKV